MNRRFALWLALVAAFTLAAAARYQPGWLQTDILALAGDSDAAPAVAAAQRKLNGQLQGSVLWMLVGPAAEAETLAHATEMLAQQLRAAAAITRLEYRWAEAERYQREWALLFPMRQQLLTGADRNLLAETPEALVRRQLAALYGPEGAGIDLERDPFATFRHYFAAGPQLATQVFGEIPVQQRGEHAFTLLQSTATPVALGGKVRTPLLQLREELQRWAEARNLTLLSVGAPLHTEYAAAGAQREIRLIGGLSIAAICLLSLLIFRSMRPLLLSVFAIAAGIASGTAAVIALLGQMHILAFVFGTTVTGLAIDYAFHFICNRMRPGPARDRDVLPGLLLGLVSSCLAFFALALTPFPLLRQMGVFVGAGLIGAWLTVVLLFPSLLKLRQRRLHIAERLPPTKPSRYLAALAVLLLVGAAALPRIEFGDDLRLFYTPPEFLAEDETQLNDLLPSRPESAYFLVQGNDWRQLLEREWQLMGELQSAREEGALADFQALSLRFPPERIQRADWELMRDFYGSAPVQGFYTQLGYSATEAQQLVAALRQPFKAVTLPEWLAVAGGQYADLWLGCNAGGCASIVRLYGLQQTASLPSSLEGVTLVDPPRAIAAVMSQQRDLLLKLLPLVLLVVTVVIALRTGARRALSIIGLPLAAVVATLALAVLSGAAINLFHVAALLLVFGIGVDYAVFSHMSGRDERSHTLLAIGMAGITTLLGFGLLALSATPAIADFGLTLAVGTTLTLVLATLFFARAVEGGNR
ncbi:Predicted exporter [Microbulbifer donghaiensis]|uniref:Predicted exporter n=1 Tax=Microbulbifer donghaiensis TaxID=494016 RepID=A0A1M5B110_9GAMM|nr:hypothetical protein [Microbulbifer donghaiensis]SHF36143.1 Predicted exporter [Microbulbifer donghaiensis]